MTADYDLIVVGEGVAGLTCASEAARLGLKLASFEAEFQGGLVVNVNELERFEEADGLSGMDHALMLAQRNAKAGVRSTTTAVTGVRPDAAGFAVESDVGTYTARAVVLATGARLKKLGVPGEAEFEGRGVSHCADCDAPMFSGAEVVVAGGGDWAVQDALILARECSLVHLVYDGAEPTACSEYIERLQAEPKVRCSPNARIEAVEGDVKGMTGVRLRDSEGKARGLPSAGLFVLTGLEPNSVIAPAGVRRDATGFLQVNDELETDVRGIWAIGQVRSGFGGWLADAVVEARRVAQIVKARLD